MSDIHQQARDRLAKLAWGIPYAECGYYSKKVVDGRVDALSDLLRGDVGEDVIELLATQLRMISKLRAERDEMRRGMVGWYDAWRTARDKLEQIIDGHQHRIAALEAGRGGECPFPEPCEQHTDEIGLMCPTCQDARERKPHRPAPYLVAAARGALSAVSPPRVVYIGSKCNQYEVCYDYDFDDPFKILSAALAAHDSGKPEKP